jgi:hypothetical protein
MTRLQPRPVLILAFDSEILDSNPVTVSILSAYAARKSVQFPTRARQQKCGIGSALSCKKFGADVVMVPTYRPLITPL